jgi:uncharacterized protein YqjF (DUF2071 family)
MSFTVGDPIPDNEVDELEHFLCARWALLTKRRRQLLYGRVHHPRWPLRRIEDLDVEQSVIESAGLPGPEGPPHTLYSPGVDVEVAWFDKVLDEEAP